MGTTLAQLKQRKIKLEKRIQKMTAAEKYRERKQETRRKILVGSYYLDQAKQRGTETALVDILAGYLTRETDRTLFGLPPRENVSQVAEKSGESQET